MKHNKNIIKTEQKMEDKFFIRKSLTAIDDKTKKHKQF